LGPLVLGPTFVNAEIQSINTGHISALKYKHLELNLVYLLYSRPINSIVIPKLDKNLAKFFTPLYDEQRCR
jgi:hypothetical protein